MKALYFLLFISFFTIGQNQEYVVLKDNQPQTELVVDQLHLDAHLRFDTVQKSVQGTAQLTLVCLQDKLKSIWLDAVGFDVKEVLVKNHKDFKYQVNDKGIELSGFKKLGSGDTLVISVMYTATPYRGLFFVGWEDLTNTANRQIWSQGQGIDNRHWLPMIDDQRDKITTHLEIEFASNYQVISNGILTEKKVGEDGTTRWVYDMKLQHSPYLIMLAIGKYDVFKQRAMGVDLYNYYYPKWAYRNEYTYYKNQEIFSTLENQIGYPYPWPNYKQVPVMNFQHGAMENTTATIFGDFFCVDSLSFHDRNYVGVNAHELAHQWFGNLVTSPNSTHHWLHEGFASYYAWLAEEAVFGPEQFQILRKKSLENVVAAEAADMYPLAHGKAGSWRFYDKGAWVLHMLRLRVGEQSWHQAIKNYLTKYAFGTANTSNLQAEMEKASGQNLETFFNQWVYWPQIPKLNMDVNYDGKKVTITIEQQLLKNQKPYELDITVKVKMTNRTQTLKLALKNEVGRSTFMLPQGELLQEVYPDPDFDLLAEWTYTGNDNLIENLAKNHDVAWYWAVRSLGTMDNYNPNIGIEMTDANVLHRIEYAKLLATKIKEDQDLAKEEITFLEYEKELEVIKTFLASTNKLPKSTIELGISWLELPSYEIQENALTLLVISDPKNAKIYLEKTKYVMGTFGNNVHVTWCFLNQVYGDKTSEEELINFMSPAFDFLTRIHAFTNAQYLNLCTDMSSQYAFSALLQNNRKLRNAGKGYMLEMCKNSSNKKIIEKWLKVNKAKFSDAELEKIKNQTQLKP